MTSFGMLAPHLSYEQAAGFLRLRHHPRGGVAASRPRVHAPDLAGARHRGPQLWILQCRPVPRMWTSSLWLSPLSSSGGPRARSPGSGPCARLRHSPSTHTQWNPRSAVSSRSAQLAHCAVGFAGMMELAVVEHLATLAATAFIIDCGWARGMVGCR